MNTYESTVMGCCATPVRGLEMPDKHRRQAGNGAKKQPAPGSVQEKG